MMTTLMSVITLLGMFLPAGKPHASHSVVILSAAAVCLGLLIVRRRNHKASH
jgi:hypothetical protein